LKKKKENSKGEPPPPGVGRVPLSNMVEGGVQPPQVSRVAVRDLQGSSHPKLPLGVARGHFWSPGISLSSTEISEPMIANRNSSSRAIKSAITMVQTNGDKMGVGKIKLRLGNNATLNIHLF